MKSIVLALLLFFSVGVFADCIHNGKSYPTGTILGPLICEPDGSWRAS